MLLTFLHCILLQMTDDDSFFYVGTSTGDILKLNTKTTLMSDYGPVKQKFSLVSGCYVLLLVNCHSVAKWILMHLT